MTTTKFEIVFEAEPAYLELCNTEFATDEDSFDHDAIEFVAETVEGFTRDDNEEYSQTVTAVEGSDETGVQPGDVMVCSGYGCNVYFVRKVSQTGVAVYGIDPHHGTDGEYDRSIESQFYPGWDSVDDYTSYLVSEHGFELLDEEEVSHLDGAIHNQNGGTVIGFRDEDGNVGYEVVYVISK